VGADSWNAVVGPQRRICRSARTASTRGAVTASPTAIIVITGSAAGISAHFRAILSVRSAPRD